MKEYVSSFLIAKIFPSQASTPFPNRKTRKVIESNRMGTEMSVA